MPPNQPNNGNEGLVSKLQEALAKFRKDRDQLHRSKELALERCRLIKAEEEALLNTVQTMRDKHNHLLTSKTKIETQMGPLEAKVQKDTIEMQFQHNELLNARNKIQQLNNQLEETSKAQQERLQKTQQLVCDLRTQQGSSSTASAALEEPLPLDDQVRGLKKEMDHNIDFMDLLAKAMDESIRQMESKVQFYRVQSSRMEEQMGIAPMEDDGTREEDRQEEPNQQGQHQSASFAPVPRAQVGNETDMQPMISTRGTAHA
ncbi:unnamed protein product [Cylindrotheca closterium]|uniref:Uncharacterized protein n=1 Tax=Cylindrotheca closterium TaxID=2856 RepID=A0AAD2G0H8_9STRA|nr:unnamed protein product [Cylindrotheca closterium]